LRDVTQAPWKEVLEPLFLFDHVLRKDPASAYARMDFDSRELYRKKVVELAEYSDFTEMQVAERAIAMARAAEHESSDDPRLAWRRSHVGFYLLDEGAELLQEKLHFRPPFPLRAQMFLRKHPDEFYLPGIEILTLGILSAIILMLTSAFAAPALIFFAMLVLLLPSSQSAIQIVNYLMTSLLRPQILPKLDFSGGIPDDCVTLVAIPTLLLKESQVQQLVDDVEVRYLGNRDRNLNFVLLSDLPDSREASSEASPLIDLCAELVRCLNEKYCEKGEEKFFLLHRHRTFNPRERVWMGWERKRGKLMDLNKLLRNEYDSFPVKVGDLEILRKARFIITLDSDTELPRGSAQRMVGTMAHPLNQAIVDPERNIVVAGYGILQPRVGVSVQSAVRSRLAAIYSGETGFDIYTRAISDVYQDLFGEAIFAGKGIYEIETLHKVLNRRFPRNALLSHDLIEGAYARVGLASDIEVIEDYPSHYSAYNRRKHRWLRGDWQITNWLLPKVPDESGRRVPNPISTISKWKILDNLRRSLVEPATLLLLVFGWTVLPGRVAYWTLATVAILFLPAWCRFAFELIRAAVVKKSVIARDAFNALLTANANVFLSLTFLAHQMLVSLDAVVRTLVRRLVTRERLLQWETAAEAEMGKAQRTPLDVYLDWTPALALALGFIVWFSRPQAIWAALPILVLWASSKLISLWLNRPPHQVHEKPSERDEIFLRQSALRTWRYFLEFSNDEHHWLIPDNVQQEPFVVAARVSPTNLGLLLNARQVACEFGFLTVPEFAEATQKTLTTIASLKKFRGHLLNWYNTQTLDPLMPMFVSSVDSGNLATSLWTLKQGAIDVLRRPLLLNSLREGILDCARILADSHALSRKRLAELDRELNSKNWLQHLAALPDDFVEAHSDKKAKISGETTWFREQARTRLAQIQKLIHDLYPWLLPQFSKISHDELTGQATALSTRLENLPRLIEQIRLRMAASSSESNGSGTEATRVQLEALLNQAKAKATQLIGDLRSVSSQAGKAADDMDFAFLLDPRRKMLSVGFDVGANKLNAACYDLLASEARIAAFFAIAKDDIPQETWFLLGRVHTMNHGRPVLLSWTGTMFEYLMPALWMRSYPDTLLDRTREAAVRTQQSYAAAKNVPWGISESAYAKRDDAGNYSYYAFGVPELALKEPEVNALVISPYSTFLALMVDYPGAMHNLRKMERKDLVGPYGFYESIDYTNGEHRSWRHNHEIVKCWMAHHQGMILLSLGNILHQEVIRRWFHSDPRVQATELLLHEKPVAYVRPVRAGYGAAAA
jgi:hypothetical protein